MESPRTSGLQKMKSLLYNILKWLSLHIFATISGTLLLSYVGLAVVDLTEAKQMTLVLVELMLLPTPLWATIALVAATYLLLKTTIYRSSVSHKEKNPNLSKKTEIQEQILNLLKTEQMPDRIAKNFGVEEQFIIRNLEILGKDLLVARNGYGSSSWYLTEHGRAYLYPAP